MINYLQSKNALSTCADKIRKDEKRKKKKLSNAAIKATSIQSLRRDLHDAETRMHAALSRADELESKLATALRK